MKRVWSLVATIAFWVAEEASVAGTVAGEGASLVANDPDLGEVSVRVEEVEPPTHVAYGWTRAFPGEGSHVFDAVGKRAEESLA